MQRGYALAEKKKKKNHQTLSLHHQHRDFLKIRTPCIKIPEIRTLFFKSLRTAWVVDFTTWFYCYLLEYLSHIEQSLFTQCSTYQHLASENSIPICLIVPYGPGKYSRNSPSYLGRCYLFLIDLHIWFLMSACPDNCLTRKYQLQDIRQTFESGKLCKYLDLSK